jgi:hypothetical protein
MEEFEPVLDVSSDKPLAMIRACEVRNWYEINGLFRSMDDRTHVRRSELQRAGVERLRVRTPYFACEIDVCSGDIVA